jgi:hypothetical protein
MRHTPAAIRQFLSQQLASDQSVVDFCTDHKLKIPTFYAWRKKYATDSSSVLQEGFCQISPLREPARRSLRLPSGLDVELVGLSVIEIAELIVQIDRAHA